MIAYLPVPVSVSVSALVLVPHLYSTLGICLIYSSILLFTDHPRLYLPSYLLKLSRLRCCPHSRLALLLCCAALCCVVLCCAASPR
ncbi:hypothetical protein F5X97DRAFT_301041 [Nemania serpens]|nr:hypothetical protein F5X97DRAFT_301041 [Nemania serpens]